MRLMTNDTNEFDQEDDFASFMKGMNAEVHVDLGWIRYAVSQTFTNTLKEPIEANYTFPVPSGAQLLSLTAQLGEKQYVGEVQPREQAQAAYESAITQGDSAILVEDLGNGLKHLSIGNLLPNETMVLNYVYVQPTRMSGQRIRVSLPTTIAPKYGDPHKSGMLPLEYPTHAAIEGYPFRLTLTLAEALQDCAIESPSHPLTYKHSTQGIALSLQGKQGMDKDCIVLIDLPHSTQAHALIAPDQAGSVVMINTLVQSPQPNYSAPVNLKILIDCSGSMDGESIVKSKEALTLIMQQLNVADQFSITKFGSHHMHFFPDLLPAHRQYKRMATDYIEKLDANLGGTEMHDALEACLAITDRHAQAVDADVLLITDGQVNDEESIIRLAKASGQRVFVVGISDAVSETFLNTLAQETKGTTGFIYPQEDAAPTIVRMFERMRGDFVTEQSITWSKSDIDWQTGLPAQIYANDSMVLGARFNQSYEQMAANLSLTWKSGANSALIINTQQATEAVAKELPRMVMGVYLDRNKIADAAEKAVAYQLLTEDTAMFMHIERAADDKGSTDPRVVNIANPIPQDQNIHVQFSRAGAPTFFQRQSSANPRHIINACRVSSDEDYAPRKESASVLFNDQALADVFKVTNIDEAHALIRALEEALMMVKAPDFLHGLEQDEYQEILQDMLSDIEIATSDMYVLWEDELLDDIYEDLLERLMARIEEALDALWEEIEQDYLGLKAI